MRAPTGGFGGIGLKYGPHTCRNSTTSSAGDAYHRAATAATSRPPSSSYMRMEASGSMRAPDAATTNFPGAIGIPKCEVQCDVAAERHAERAHLFDLARDPSNAVR